jgi:hypothetical protein
LLVCKRDYRLRFAAFLFGAALRFAAFLFGAALRFAAFLFGAALRFVAIAEFGIFIVFQWLN